MPDQKSARGTGLHGGEDQSGELPVAYEAPRVIVLGSIVQMTSGANTSGPTDGLFPGSLFK